MLKYVKVCPRCGHENPEDAFNCSICNHSLIMEPAVPASGQTSGLKEEPLHPSPTWKEPGIQNAPVVTEKQAPPQEQTQHYPVTRRYPQSNFFLELPGTSRQYEVNDGYILGQEHPTNNAQIQLSGIEGVNFIHRQHCRFEFSSGEWYVTPLPQADFTNPTTLNLQRLQTGQKYKIMNGDRLTLCRITFYIRIF